MTDKTKTEQDVIAEVFGLTPDMIDGTPARPAAEEADEMRALWGEPEPAPAKGKEPSVGTEGEPAGEDAPASKPAGSTPASPQEPEGTAPAPSAQPSEAPPAPADAQPAAPPAQPTSDPKDAELAALRSQIASLTAIVTAKQEQQPAADGQQETPAKPAQPQVTPIPVQLPPQLLGDIFGDDPTKAANALNAFASQMATGLNYRFTLMLQEAENRLLEKLQGQEQALTQREEQRTAEELRQDYFKQFPDHNKPILQPLVAQAAADLAAETPGRQWDNSFRDALGARVNQMLEELGARKAPQPAPTAPATMLPDSTRSAVDATPDIIAETFGLG